LSSVFYFLSRNIAVVRGNVQWLRITQHWSRTFLSTPENTWCYSQFRVIMSICVMILIYS